MAAKISTADSLNTRNQRSLRWFAKVSNLRSSDRHAWWYPMAITTSTSFACSHAPCFRPKPSHSHRPSSSAGTISRLMNR